MNRISPAIAGLVLSFACAAPVLANDSAPIDLGSLTIITYDGTQDDLLSAGLNLAGLVSAAAPGFVDPLNPTPAELRRRAIHSNYRGIVDPAPAGGMGVLWGPGAGGDRFPTFSGVARGLIPGVEYKAYLRLPERHPHVNNIPAAVQIPQHFNPNKPCIVAAMPSGSRSLYGGIAIAEWALIKGCAVALPGKGTDTGFHLLTPDLADDVNGVYGPADTLGRDAQFAVHDNHRLREYVSENPHRVATKHAHSQINPERLWGEFGLQGIEFAFWALNEHFPNKRFTRKNTIVIAAGASNGGGMALRAAEDDREGLIDAVVVTEPNIQPRAGRFTIKFGSDPAFEPDGRTIYDSMTLMSVYAACAMQHSSLAGTPFFGAQPLGVNRCTSLREKGLVTDDDDIQVQAASALAQLRAHGYAAAQDWGIASHEVLNLWRSLQPTYAGAYGRFAVQDNICGVSFAATDAAGRPAAISEIVAKQLFSNSSGIPPTGGVTIPGTPPTVLSGVNLIADQAANSPILENAAISRSTGRADLNIDSALCFRALQTGEGLTSGRDWVNHARVRFGTREVQTTGRLHGKPTTIIHGRRDALVFPNLHSRAYYALNQQEEHGKSRVRYLEVSTGQHFDAFISNLFIGPAGAQFVPLHYYFVLAMDNMYAHLTAGTALPPSQVVKPKPRGTTTYTLENLAADPELLPPPSSNPGGNRITFENGVLTIPE